MNSHVPSGRPKRHPVTERPEPTVSSTDRGRPRMFGSFSPRLVVSGLVALTLVFGGCGGSESESESATSSTAADAQALQDRVDELERKAQAREEAAARRERAARKREREARRATRKAREEEKRAEAAPPPADPSAPATGGGGGITVPDVVGLDHQAAQDALQGEGLYSLDERDCSGQGRALLFDRNWEVVSTDPPAGTQVSADDTITLCSVKQGEQ